MNIELRVLVLQPLYVLVYQAASSDVYMRKIHV